MLHHLCCSKPTIKLTTTSILLSGMLLLSACDSIQTNPHNQVIPANSETWESELADTLAQLPQQERDLVSRYMLRIKLSDAYEAGAAERVSIGDAIELQQIYERLHPNNPTGKKSPIIRSDDALTAAQTYPIVLLPLKVAASDDTNAIKLRFILSNLGDVPIAAFEGRLSLKAKDFAKPTYIDIEPIEFSPPIAVNDADKLIEEAKLEELNVMRAIKDVSLVDVVISEGRITLTDGRTVDIMQQHNQTSY